MNNQERYCVTARNKLTGQRDIVTPPCSKETAQLVLDRFRQQRKPGSPYSYPLIYPYKPSKKNQL